MELGNSILVSDVSVDNDVNQEFEECRQSDNIHHEILSVAQDTSNNNPNSDSIPNILQLN